MGDAICLHESIVDTDTPIVDWDVMPASWRGGALDDVARGNYTRVAIKGTTTEGRCDACGSILYEITQVDGQPPDRVVLDDVYRSYYTREGRIKMLAELLEDASRPVPECWALAEVRHA